MKLGVGCREHGSIIGEEKVNILPNGGFMEVEKTGRTMIQLVPVTGGIVGYRCSRCGWAFTVSTGDTIIRPDALFESHRCEEREGN